MDQGGARHPVSALPWSPQLPRRAAAAPRAVRAFCSRDSAQPTHMPMRVLPLPMQVAEGRTGNPRMEGGALRASPGSSLEALAGFLQGHSVLSEGLDYSAGEGKPQKCACIAQEGLGLDLVYRHRLHAHGTLSTRIAADLAKLLGRTARAGGASMPARFRHRVPHARLRKGRWLDLRGVNRDPREVMQARRAQKPRGENVSKPHQGACGCRDARGGRDPRAGARGARTTKIASRAGARACASGLSARVCSARPSASACSGAGTP